MLEGKWVIWHDNQTLACAEEIAQRWAEKYGKEMYIKVEPSELHPGKYQVKVCKK